LADYRIGVIGIPGKWSTETLADAVEERTGYRLVIDMAEVSLDLEDNRLLFQGQDLCQLDALIVKKISATYSPNTLDRLELLRVAEQAGVRVFSRAESILRLIDRLSCTVTLRNAGIPMPATRVTEDAGAALTAVQDFGSAVFKPLYSTKARGMCVIDAQQERDGMESEIRAFHGTWGWCSWRANTLAAMPGFRRAMPGTRPSTAAVDMPPIHQPIA
jgi:ribosomal protein S6--L-glutamate ligase